ncbi:MAG: MarR family winged helix-turn-helix transcriptional regulator [Pseudomonadota bacterium]
MRIGMLFGMLYNSLANRFNKDMDEIGLTSSQSYVMGYLIHNEGREINQKDIEEALRLMNPTVTGILNRLEKKGFIIRRKSESDKRYKIVEITEKGRLIKDKMAEKAVAANTALFSGVSESELAAFEKTLRKLMKNVME